MKAKTLRDWHLNRAAMVATLMLSACEPAYAQDNGFEVVQSAHDACHKHINTIDGTDDPDGFYGANCPTVNALFEQMQNEQMTKRERDSIAAMKQPKVYERNSVLDAMRIARGRNVQPSSSGDQ